MTRALKSVLVLGVLATVGAVISMSMGGGGQPASGPGSEIPSPDRGPTPFIPTEEQTAVGPSLPPEGNQLPAVLPADRFERSEAGARAAAVAYLEATEDAVAMTPIEAAAVQRRIATAGFADVFAADTEQRMTELIVSVPGGIRLRVAPIEARSVADGDDWLVSVWYAQAITLIGEGVVDDWRTAHYRMRWEDGTWKIASFESDRGPMPGRGTQAASATPTEFEALLLGFTDDGLS